METLNGRHAEDILSDSKECTDRIKQMLGGLSA